MLKSFLVIITLVCCGRDQTVTPSLRDVLADQYAMKLKELRELSQEQVAGWPTDHDCDGALWAGVARAAGAEWVDVSTALRPDGRPTRRPLRDCVTPDESKTTTSNDMITGIMLGLYANKDEETILRLYRYGEDNKWIMGYPETYVSRVLLRPNGITLLARMLYDLSEGSRDYAIRLAPLVYGPTDGDYESHLALLSRYMEQEIGGAQYGAEWKEDYLAKSYPLDALAQAVAGRYMTAALLLTREYKSPSYVRGSDIYHLVHWLFAAKVVLDRAQPGQMLDSK